jgi:2-oxoglutarate dehydrogenase E1 component
MMPKSSLRYSPSFSNLSEFTDANFQLVLDDPARIQRDDVKRIVFCSGKVFYALSEARTRAELPNVAIVRIEQLYPFPKKEIQAILAKYRQAREICWVQEEPRNRGGWRFIEDKLRDMLPDPAVLTYYGRDEAASPATGSMKAHTDEEREFIAHALDVPPSQRQVVAQVAAQQPATAASATPVSD